MYDYACMTVRVLPTYILFKIKYIALKFKTKNSCLKLTFLFLSLVFALIVFNHNFYDVFSSIEPKDALTCTEIQPLAELQRVDVGLGRQTVRLEFSTDCSSYTLVTRNADKVEVFIQRMSGGSIYI